MKKIILAVALIFASCAAFAGDGVVFATSEDLAAFDQLLKKSQRTNRGSQKANISEEVGQALKADGSVSGSTRASKRQNTLKKASGQGQGALKSGNSGRGKGKQK